jgi:hypothetical protein
MGSMSWKCYLLFIIFFLVNDNINNFFGGKISAFKISITINVPKFEMHPMQVQTVHLDSLWIIK